MVNMRVVRQRLMRGLFVGIGAFGSSFVGSFVEGQLGTGDVGTSAAQVAVGLGVSVGSDEVFGNTDALPNDFMEFAGYGVQGAGWSNLGTAVQTGANTGASTVRVSSGSSGGQTGQEVVNRGGSQFSLQT